jgi:phosphoserine phosphatase
MPTIVLIRPGSTDFDDQHRVQGALDLPLNPRGEEQVQEVIDALRDVPLDLVLTAPGEPARSTAEAIGSELELPVKESEGLRNLNQGLWQGLQIEEVRRKHPKVFKQWQESPETICPPEGEMVGAALERIRKCLHKHLKRKASVAIVASEPMATLVACVLTGTRPEIPDPGRCCREARLIEFLSTNGQSPVGLKDDLGLDSSPEIEIAGRGGHSR